MFGKWFNEEELKSAKEKKKALKKRIRELSQSEIMRKLQADLELSQARAQHFENEYFMLKKSHEVLNDSYQTIFGADQQLQSELYELTKVIKAKDENIVELTSLIEKQADEIVNLLAEKSELTTEEVNDQINELLKPKENGTENR